MNAAGEWIEIKVDKPETWPNGRCLGWGSVHEEPILLTESGSRMLCRYLRDVKQGHGVTHWAPINLPL